ncbi:MAG: helix-turn-helix domain-containing protein [Nitrospinaceae bacterium]|nr:helix-turn-helix domain-containing protein [Nitrospinaceae bacterium]NIR53803.1 helix-turn-helix domain-containing protein [Nitrospinaceae bacterium]NIS84214.1 helix-turn-helix domain-containing protein [Nitrospinaceae bacterium]NIT81020.1 helix-turn-helix domain-containing protein [Nitrospinaceae bacterium]NIU43309.1 helix-turn-helix domain-containing protein [Nitrospinaceae bacterium]
MQDKKGGTAKNLGTRLRQWRKQLPLKSFELAKLIKISQGSLSDIENNKSLPSADTIAKLYQYTELNIIWLLTGKGAMFRNTSGAVEIDSAELVQESMEEYGEDQKLRELIEKVIRIYRKGTQEKRAHLVGFLNGADPGEG